MITGGVKTTPVLAMQLLCDLQPFTNIIEKNAAILFNRLIRLPNNSFWRDYDSDGGRNLKTQKGFIQCVHENIQYKVINDVPFELLSFANPLDYAILDIRLDLVLNVRKRDLSPTALHAIALETINTRFPPEDHLFSFYLHAGPLTTHFDGEVEAIHIALQQLAVRLPPIERAVILSDSTSALQALSNYNENNCLRVQNCRELLGKIKGKIVFQWVPSHCGLWGNEGADFLAKKGTGILQNFRRDLTLHSAKLEIKRIFRESFRLKASRVARDKPWSTLCKKSHGIPSSPRAAVAKFRHLTGHDCLCGHLFRFNLVTSPICVLCDTGQDMTADHLDECSALNDLNCIVKRSSGKVFKKRRGNFNQGRISNSESTVRSDSVPQPSSASNIIATTFVPPRSAKAEIGKPCTYEVNTRLVYAMRCIGKGSEAARMFCGIMNLPPPPTKFSKYNKMLLGATKDVCDATMKDAVKEAVQENQNIRHSCGG
ncbi:uncharacterized protein LOC103524116 [Trichonephila clavipes]|nr:uncharacterized protein LOC103524116 [Trichonephila clavipes]